jgi:deoxyribodipyrimidine photo-lyase
MSAEGLPNLRQFPPTLAAARERIAAVRPGEYARSRNFLHGSVSGLSPYITHGFVSLPDVLAGVLERHRLDVQHKFVFELGWRAYFQHVWQHLGDTILQSLHTGVLPDSAYASSLPADIREGRTGLPVVDQAVRTLYSTGYLHNHARMWLASYTVHVRKVHWCVGAEWMYAHLLDGDLASNHLSWQWVAGTGSTKPYLFNADNVARYAPQSWHSPGTLIDTTYEALDRMAHSLQPVSASSGLTDAEGVQEPACHGQVPGNTGMDAVRSDPVTAADVAGRDVWLVHPWALGELPSDLPEACLRLGWWPTAHFSAHPWSTARWAFVRARMDALAHVQTISDGAALGDLLSGARSVHTVTNGHIDRFLPARVQGRGEALLFPKVDSYCASFSRWWARATRGLKHLSDLPGIDAEPPSRFFHRTPQNHGH